MDDDETEESKQITLMHEQLKLLDDKIAFRVEENKKYQAKVGERLKRGEGVLRENTRKSSLVYQKKALEEKEEALKKEIEHLERDLNAECDFILEKCNSMVELINRVRALDLAVKKHIKDTQDSKLQEKVTKIEKTLKQTRSQLLKKVANVTRLKEKSLFNLSLNDITTNCVVWTKLLTPEQIEVVINYIHHVVRVFVMYFQIPIRYEIRQDLGVIIDPVTDTQLKMFESNYRLFKNENTLQNALLCFNSIIQSLHALVDRKAYAEIEPLVCLTEIVEEKHLKERLQAEKQEKQEKERKAQTQKDQQKTKVIKVPEPADPAESNVLTMSSQNLFKEAASLTASTKVKKI